VRTFGVEGDLAPSERQIIFGDPSDHERLQASWRVEAAVPLLWYIGIVAELDRPDRVADVESLARAVLNLEPADFYAGVNARDVAEVLDQADLIYRYHWAARNTQLQGAAAPAGLDGAVVVERHHALNWLIGDGDRAGIGTTSPPIPDFADGARRSAAAANAAGSANTLEINHESFGGIRFNRGPTRW